MDFTAIQLSAWVVALLGGTISPVLTGLVTKLGASSGTKALMALIITALIAVVDAVVNANGAFNPSALVTLFVVTFVAHASSYWNFWRPVGVPGVLATAEFGVG